MGSVFSPYYAWARARGRGDPENFCALNVALYGPRGARGWAMTERGASSMARSAATLMIGPSAAHWDGNAFIVAVDERGAPIPRAVRGTIRVIPDAINDRGFLLDPAGKHRWRPIAPSARIEVAFARPAVSWSGHAYLDSNDGDRPLEADFSQWDWCRVPLGGGETAVLYEATRRDGGRTAIATRFAADGCSEDFDPPASAALPRTRWLLDRRTRAESAPRVLRSLEDGPFYARSVLSTKLLSVDAIGVHETLSLDRFSQPIVRAMLPFRMPRWR